MTEHHTPLALTKLDFSNEWAVVKVNSRQIITDKWPLAIESQMQLDDALANSAWLKCLLEELGMSRDELADHFGVSIRSVNDSEDIEP